MGWKGGDTDVKFPSLYSLTNSCDNLPRMLSAAKSRLPLVTNFCCKKGATVITVRVLRVKSLQVEMHLTEIRILWVLDQVEKRELFH